MRTGGLIVAAALLIVASTLLSPEGADGGTVSEPLELHRTSLFRFIDALIEGLSWAKLGSDKQERAANIPVPLSPEGNRTWMRDMAATIGVAANDYRLAMTTVEPFEKAPEEIVREAAKSFVLALTVVMQMNDKIRTMMTATLDHGRTFDQQTLADVQVKRDEAWHLIFNAATAAATALTYVPEHRTDPVTTIRVTKDERRRLMKHLLHSFGNDVAKRKPDDTTINGSATLLYATLARDLKPMDAKP